MIVSFIEAVIFLPQAQAVAVSVVSSMNVGLLVSNTADAFDRRRQHRSETTGVTTRRETRA